MLHPLYMLIFATLTSQAVAPKCSRSQYEIDHAAVTSDLYIPCPEYGSSGSIRGNPITGPYDRFDVTCGSRGQCCRCTLDAMANSSSVADDQGGNQCWDRSRQLDGGYVTDPSACHPCG